MARIDKARLKTAFFQQMRHHPATKYLAEGKETVLYLQTVLAKKSHAFQYFLYLCKFGRHVHILGRSFLPETEIFERFGIILSPRSLFQHIFQHIGRATPGRAYNEYLAHSRLVAYNVQGMFQGGAFRSR